MNTHYIKEFTEALLQGDQSKSWSVIQNAVNDGVASRELYYELITPAMVDIGVKWQENEISVADEHLATSTCDFTLARYKHEVIVPKVQTLEKKHGKALFLCVENEEHDLGIRMTSHLFEEDGWDVRMVGANLPVEYVEKMGAAWEPDVIGLSASMLKQGERVPRYIQRLMGSLPQAELLIGGRFLTLLDEPKISEDRVTYIQTADQLDTFLRSRGEV